MNIHQITLKNNLNVLFVDSKGASAASIQIWFRAGSALENENDQGIAHFLEHMFFKGTPKRSGKTLAQEVESFGGEFNAFTSFDYTCYYINSPAKHINQSVDILLDMVSHPLFSNEDFPPERQVVFEEYKRALDNPSQYNFMEVQKNCFTGKYSHPIIGNEETILNFSKEQLSDFREKFYNNANALLVVAGDLKNKNEIQTTIESYQLPSGEKSQFEEFNLSSKNSLSIHEKDVKIATLTIAFPAPEYLSEVAANEDMAMNCLAHGESSRLYKRLVTETSVCNNILGYSMYFSKKGMHVFKLNFPLSNLAKIRNIFFSTIEDCLQHGFKADELEKIKNQYIASKIYEKESIEAFAFSKGHGFAQNGDIQCEDHFIQNIKNTNAINVSSSLSSIFKNNFHLILQVPKKAKNKGLEVELNRWSNQLSNLKKLSKKSSEFKASVSKFDDTVKVFKLKPGIDLIYRHNDMTPTFVFHAYLRGGQTEETKTNMGTYHLLSKLLTYGHKNATYEEIRNELDFLSASLSGFSGKNAYGLTLHGQTHDFEKLMNHFMYTLMTPSMPKKYLIHEKKLAARYLDHQKEDPIKVAFREFYQAVFNNHPYSFNIIGTNDSLKKATENSLKTLHQKKLNQSPIVFTYCGNLPSEVIISFLNNFLEKFKNRKFVAPKIKKFKPLVSKIISKSLPREQTQIIIGKPAFNIKDKNDIYLKMLTTYLSGMSSDLFTEVRDRQGLCYSVSPVHLSALEAGCWGIYIGTGNEKVEAAKSAIFKILNNLNTNGINKIEFERIKKTIEGQNQLNLQTNEDHAQFYSISYLQQLGLDFLHESNNKIQNTSFDEFQKFLKVFLKPNWNIVVVGKL